MHVFSGHWVLFRDATGPVRLGPAHPRQPCPHMHANESISALSWSQEDFPVLVCAPLEWKGSQNRFSCRPGPGDTY